MFSTQPAISSSGVLTFTSAANSSGSASVSVVLTDDGGTANSGDDIANDTAHHGFGAFGGNVFPGVVGL